MSLGGPRLLDEATLSIETGERIGLLGRNGSGKSTLLKMLEGAIPPDSGEIVASTGTRVSLLPQEVPETLPGTVYEIAAAGGQAHLDVLRQYHDLTVQLAHGGDEGLLKELERVQHRLETSGAWQFHQRVETVIGWTGLEEDAEFRLLSAGSKRRALLARALANEPDLLLLDEPTNHLDLNAILWLEDFLLRFNKTLIFVTHDRSFLQRMATRIVELDRGRLLSYDCDYDTYLTRRQAVLDAEEKAHQDFDRKLAQEEAWIRQGIKARRTRNEGRVRALEQLRLERDRRRERMGNPRLAIMEAKRSGRLVVEAESISFAFEDTIVLHNFSTAIIRGDRVGILGPNGAGKTTLLRVLLGEMEPQKGRVRLGAGLQIAYFDQLRAQLDETRSLKDVVAGGGETVSVGGTTRHVVGYLRDFLFAPEQILSPVRLLSGGERNRLLLAKLFCTPSNVLVLDEPTNDLDLETLSLLEAQLLDYSGTILLVSHDRAFLNNVVTSTIVFEGNGRLGEYVGGYDDWLRRRNQPVEAAEPRAARAPRTGEAAGEAAGRPARPQRESSPAAKRRLSYKEAAELDALPQRIEAMEEETEAIVAALSSSEFYAGEPGGDTAQAIAAQVSEAQARLEALHLRLEEAYARWQYLEDVGG